MFFLILFFVSLCSAHALRFSLIQIISSFNYTLYVHRQTEIFQLQEVLKMDTHVIAVVILEQEQYLLANTSYRSARSSSLIFFGSQSGSNR